MPPLHRISDIFEENNHPYYSDQDNNIYHHYSYLYDEVCAQPKKQVSQLDRKILDFWKKNGEEIYNLNNKKISRENIILRDKEKSLDLFQYLIGKSYSIDTKYIENNYDRVFVEIEYYFYRICSKHARDTNKKIKLGDLNYNLFDQEKPETVWNVIYNHILSKKERIETILGKTLSEKDIKRLTRIVFEVGKGIQYNDPQVQF